MKPRKVLVLGGSSGIGAAIAKAFQQAGDEVLIASRSTPAASKGAPRHIRIDVTKTEAMRKAIDGLGALDVLVYSAGRSGWRDLFAIDEAFWQAMVDTNLKGALFATQAAAKNMRRGASIIHVSSLAGKRGSARNSVYCATKFGITGITQALAKELGSKGIRVNAVCPVYVDTPGLRAALRDKDAPPEGADVDAYLKEFTKAQSALGRMPSADEVASTCLFLASEAASAITGQSINVDCGVLPQ